MNASKTSALFDDLEALAGVALGTHEYRVLVKRTRGVAYISGVPYPLTGFIERAYVFRSREDAERIAAKHFANCETQVLEHERVAS